MASVLQYCIESANLNFFGIAPSRLQKLQDVCRKTDTERNKSAYVFEDSL